MERDALRGLARVERLYADRSARARALAGEGRKVIGYLCGLVPQELITAAGLVPYRITGNPGEPIAEALDYFEPNVCNYVLNCFQQALRGRYDFLAGIVIPHACDTVQRLYGLWKFWRPPDYTHFLNVPTVVTPEAVQFFREELELFKESLETFAGRTIDRAVLNESIGLHNENRRLIRGLYESRKTNPPALSAGEMMRLLVVGTAIPADEFKSLLVEVTEEVQGRTVSGNPEKVRLLLYGCIVDNAGLPELIEGQGGIVVVDDTCIGTRSFSRDVEIGNDPLGSLSRVYFSEFLCPKIVPDWQASRFAYLADMAHDYGVKGVVAYLLSWCDPHKFDMPVLRDYLNEAGYPMLAIEDDYTLSSSGSIQSRVQAFVEMLRQQD